MSSSTSTSTSGGVTGGGTTTMLCAIPAWAMRPFFKHKASDYLWLPTF
jgi:hypothetical protein